MKLIETVLPFNYNYFIKFNYNEALSSRTTV